MKLTETRILNDIFVHWSENEGFFHFLYYWASHESPQIEIPWLPNSDIANMLDWEYHGNTSGDKPASALLDKFLKDIEEIGQAYFLRFAELWYRLFADTVNREFAVLSSQYNPIENYSMTESSSDSKTGTDILVKSGNQSRAMTGGRKVQTETKDSIQGFNSSTYNPDTKTEITDKTTYTDDNGNAETETETFNNVTDTTTYNSGVSHGMTRSGNIGTTTTQQMLQSEIDLWKWNFYHDILFPAVDKILICPMYINFREGYTL